MGIFKYIRILERLFKQQNIRDSEFLSDFKNLLEKESSKRVTLKQLMMIYGEPHEILTSYLREMTGESTRSRSKLNVCKIPLIIVSLFILCCCIYYTTNKHVGTNHFITREIIVDKGD